MYRSLCLRIVEGCGWTYRMIQVHFRLISGPRHCWCVVWLECLEGKKYGFNVSDSKTCWTLNPEDPSGPGDKKIPAKTHKVPVIHGRYPEKAHPQTVCPSLNLPRCPCRYHVFPGPQHRGWGTSGVKSETLLTWGQHGDLKSLDSFLSNLLNQHEEASIARKPAKPANPLANATSKWLMIWVVESNFRIFQANASQPSPLSKHWTHNQNDSYSPFLHAIFSTQNTLSWRTNVRHGFDTWAVVCSSWTSFKARSWLSWLSWFGDDFRLPGYRIQMVCEDGCAKCLLPTVFFLLSFCKAWKRIDFGWSRGISMKPAKDSRVRVCHSDCLCSCTWHRNPELKASGRYNDGTSNTHHETVQIPQSRDSLGFTMIFPFILSHSPIFIKGSIEEHIFPNWFHHQHLQQEKTVSVGKGFCAGKSSCVAWTGPSNKLDKLYNPIPFHNWYVLCC